jgi:Putative zinc-finger
MKAEGCRVWREHLGALVLGQLEPAERAATEAHLEGCPACRAEADALAPMASLLSRADPERLAIAAGPPADLGERIARRIVAERRSTRRRRLRWGLAAATAAAAATAMTILAISLSGGSSNGSTETVAFTNLPRGASIEASLDPRPWGSDLRVRVRGFRPGTLCTVWLKRADGTKVPAGSFRYVYAGEDDQASLSAAVSPDDATAIGLRAGSVTFVAPLPAHGPSAGVGAHRSPPGGEGT